MRILYLTEESISFSNPMVRGGAIHVRNVIKGLRDQGHEVVLIDWNPSPEVSHQYSVNPRSRFFDGTMRTFLEAVRTAYKKEVDVIISKTRKTYVAGLIAARIVGVPHVVHVGSSLEPPVEGIIDRLDVGSFEARLRAPHDAYFVVCDAISEELRRRGVSRDRIFNVRNAVDTSQFKPNPTVSLSEDIETKLRNIDGQILGYVGGIIEYKGVFDLAEALEYMQINPTILVAGDGPGKQEFADQLGDRGIFLGSVSYERMPALYAAIDALVLPSHTEGLPRVILEAGAAGRPVVATRVGGVPEIVAEGVTGLLCPSDQPQRLAERIDELFAERNPVAMGKAARERIVDQFTWTAQYDRYERFLRDVTNRA